MSPRLRAGCISAFLLLAVGGRLAAQAWDAPSFFSPRLHDDLGLYAFVPEHGDLGIQGLWRQSGNLNLGVRAGIAEEMVLVGAEFYGPLRLAESPLLLAWQLGFGAGFNDVTLLRVPVGVSLGLDLAGQGVPQLTPYIFPRLALELAAVDTGDDEETTTDLDFALDVGADFALSPELTLRAGATLAERSAFGAGIAYRLQRRVLVR